MYIARGRVTCQLIVSPLCNCVACSSWNKVLKSKSKQSKIPLLGISSAWAFIEKTGSWIVGSTSSWWRLSGPFICLISIWNVKIDWRLLSNYCCKSWSRRLISASVRRKSRKLNCGKYTWLIKVFWPIHMSIWQIFSMPATESYGNSHAFDEVHWRSSTAFPFCAVLSLCRLPAEVRSRGLYILCEELCVVAMLSNKL